MATEGFAPAKINLTLHVTGQRADGYHLLDSLVVFADIGDHLQVTENDILSLEVTGPFKAGVPTDGSNLVLRAAELLRALRGVTAGAHLCLEKQLPHGGGIGGGSSDAAVALKLLAEFWKVPTLGEDEALALGADVPVCLRSPHPTIMRGIGDELSAAPDLPEGWLVLVNPGVPVPTDVVFGLHDSLYSTDNPPMDILPVGMDDDAFLIWLLGQRNDLTKVACEPRIAAVVQDVLKALRPHAEVAEMSGSGSTCWGWFRTEMAALNAANTLTHAHPDWWVRSARVLRP